MVDRILYVMEDRTMPIVVGDGQDALAFEDKNAVSIHMFSDEVYMTREEWDELSILVEEYFDSK